MSALHRIKSAFLAAMAALAFVAQPAFAQVDTTARGTARITAQAQANGKLRGQARLFLTAAQRGIGIITDVMASPPTYTQGATSATSTITGFTSAGTNFGGGRYQPHDANKFEVIGGTMTNDGSRFLPDTVINNTSTLVRGGSHGVGLRFATDADAFDFAMDSGSPFTLYVTDMTTGIRQRAATNDYTSASGYSYHKFVFADARPRIIELYPDPFAKIRSFNVAAAYSIWRAPAAAEPRFAVLWDSWGGGGGADASLANIKVKQTVTDYMGERLGIRAVYNVSVGSTGVIAPAGTLGTFLDRMTLGGDLSVARAGKLDGVLSPCSINDAASSDAAVQAAYQATIAYLMTQQPGAFIIGMGSSTRATVITPQSRFDACKAGFLAAAGNDPRMIWIDNSPSGENWLFGPTATGNVSIYLGSDDYHLNALGMAWYGRRLGASIVDAFTKLVTTGPLAANDRGPPLVIETANDNERFIPIRLAA